MNSNRRKKGWKNFKGAEHPLSKAVIQYDLEGNRIQTFDSIEQASSYLHIPKGNITRVCQRKGKRAGQFIFKYKYPTLQKCYSIDKDEQTKPYYTVLIAARINNLKPEDILSVIEGKKDSLKGLKWSFLKK